MIQEFPCEITADTQGEDIVVYHGQMLPYYAKLVHLDSFKECLLSVTKEHRKATFYVERLPVGRYVAIIQWL